MSADVREETPAICMDPAAHFRAPKIGVPRGKLLTDKKISKYQEKGWYSAEFKQARKDLYARRKARREGNFVNNEEGRLIYSPF